MSTIQRQSNYVLALIFTIGVILSTVIVTTANSATDRSPSKSAAINFLKEPIPVANFQLHDHAQKQFSREHLLGHWTFLYFGYLNCPDICPLTMSVLQHVWQDYPKIHGDPDAAQVVFVSVDPDRDTTDKLAAYLKYFNPEFIGVSGSDEELEKFAKNVGSIFAYEDDPRDDDSYIVQHTTDLFLVNPDGYVVARLPEPHTAKSVFQTLQTAKEKR